MSAAKPARERQPDARQTTVDEHIALQEAADELVRLAAEITRRARAEAAE